MFKHSARYLTAVYLNDQERLWLEIEARRRRLPLSATIRAILNHWRNISSNAPTRRDRIEDLPEYEERQYYHFYDGANPTQEPRIEHERSCCPNGHQPMDDSQTD